MDYFNPDPEPIFKNSCLITWSTIVIIHLQICVVLSINIAFAIVLLDKKFSMHDIVGIGLNEDPTESRNSYLFCLFSKIK